MALSMHGALYSSQGIKLFTYNKCTCISIKGCVSRYTTNTYQGELASHLQDIVSFLQVRRFHVLKFCCLKYLCGISMYLKLSIAHCVIFLSHACILVIIVIFFVSSQQCRYQDVYIRAYYDKKISYIQCSIILNTYCAKLGSYSFT